MRVLIGVDGSPSAERAVSLAANLAWPFGTTIDIVTAYPGMGVLFGMPGVVASPDVVQRTEDAMEAEARRIASNAADRLAAPHLDTETCVTRDRAASALLDEAARFGADLIVLGNRGRSPFESTVLGSVSAEVVDRTTVPVLIARRDRLARILLADDGSPSAAAAVHLVRHWSPLHRGPVRVMSVVDTDRTWAAWLRAAGRGGALDDAHERSREAYEALARRTAARLRAAGLDVDSEVEDGNPAHQIVEAAVNWDADLIVLGTHGRSGLERLLVGSVARAVLHHAPCSILVAPDPAEVDAHIGASVAAAAR